MEQIDIVAAMQQPRGDSHGQHRVVGEPATLDEQRKVLRLGGGGFMNRADDVTANGTDHRAPNESDR